MNLRLSFLTIIFIRIYRVHGNLRPLLLSAIVTHYTLTVLLLLYSKCRDIVGLIYDIDTLDLKMRAIFQ